MNVNPKIENVIYKITNILNGKFYIGSACIYKNRVAMHLCQLRKNKHSNLYLQRTFNKYGEFIFLFEIIEFCNENDLIKKEQWYIDNWKPNYNICKVAGNTKGFKHSEETKKKMSIAKKVPKSQAWKDSRKGKFRKGSNKSIMVYKNNEFFGEFISICECSRTLNISESSISKVANGKQQQTREYNIKFK